MENEELNVFVGIQRLGICNHVSLNTLPKRFCDEMIQSGYSFLSKGKHEMIFKAELPRFGSCSIHVYTSSKKSPIGHVRIITERKMREGEMLPLLEYMKQSMPVKPLYDDLG